MLTKKKLIIITIGSILAIAGISFGTFFVLRGLQDKASEEPIASNMPTLMTAPSAQEFIQLYQDEASIIEQTKNYKERTQNYTNSTITYTPEGVGYGVTQGVMDVAQYDISDADASENNGALISATREILRKHNLVTVLKNEDVKGITKTTYDSLNTVCVTTEIDRFGSQPASFGLACAEKTIFNTLAATVNERLKLVGESVKKDITKVTPSEPIVEANKSLQSLQVTYKDMSGTILLFAALDGSWSYLGERSIPNVDDQDSYKISDTLKTKIKDSKWNGFLEKYISWDE